MPAESVLVQYSFEEETETGPDTFAIFQHAQGTVTLSPTFRVSGYRSVRIKDHPASGNFPELQGYFFLRRTGHVFVHFAFLVVDPMQELNIALAGPERFRLAKDGIAFWLTLQEGVLRHYTDSIPKRLASLRAFTWYEVEVDYDVERGVYDLTLGEEGRSDPLVALRAQPNAPHQPGSAVNVFSFIGDLEDRSDVEYFVDDVLVGTDARVLQAPFMAPGRRKLFIDAFQETQRMLQTRLRCFPIRTVRDLGLNEQDLSAQAVSLLEQPALASWREGCDALDKRDPLRAVSRFTASIDRAPTSALYRLSLVIALIEAGQLERAEEALRGAADETDPRFLITSAVLGLKRGDADRAEQTLRDLALNAAGDAPEVAARYFHVLLWQSRWNDARSYAESIAAIETLPLATRADWTERAGDAALLARDLPLAEHFYQRALQWEGSRASTTLKMADVAFLRVDLDGERHWRERIYGALREK